VGGQVVEVPDAVKSPMVTWIGYSSAGALVKYTDLVTDDPGAREQTMLVTPNGETRDLGKIRSATSDPGSSVIVYARATDEPDTWELVALDLANGEERTSESRSAPTGEHSWSGPAT
jgi:hypothetical protein